MITSLLAVIAALALALCLALIWGYLRGRKPRAPTTTFVTQQIQAVGDLVALKVKTQQIVRHSDHLWGAVGQKYFAWVLSQRKMILLFDLLIEFRYDLRSASFGIERDSSGHTRIVMPPCKTQVFFNDIIFCDEQGGALMSWLLPGLIANIPGGFSPDERNRLKDEARNQALAYAQEQLLALRPEIEHSATHILTAMGKGFGIPNIEVKYALDEATNAVVVTMGPKLAA